MSDFHVFIRTDAPNPVRLVVQSAGGAEIHIDRLVKPSLDEVALDRLRGGDADAATITGVVNEVTNWFLGADVYNILQGALGQQKTRVVIQADAKLEQVFANVPFELARWDVTDYLLLLDNLTGLVYVPRTTPVSKAATAQQVFRVLLVRAEPNNYTGTVPSGIALRDTLRAVVPASAAGAVEVRLLSHEPGADGRPTSDQLATEVTTRPPAVILYIGHGDLLAGGGGGPPSPVLYLEDPDGEQHELPASSLRALLKETPVPLVVLAACLTGAAGAATSGPERLRFGQSMAQFLVSGEGGVTVAIGMRYKFEANDATLFLGELFGALVGGPDAGNVDLAVKHGRRELFRRNAQTLGWAAPIVYRRAIQEPLFSALRPRAQVQAAAGGPTDDLRATREQLAILCGQPDLASPLSRALALPVIERMANAIVQIVHTQLAVNGTVGLLPRVGAGPASIAVVRPNSGHMVRFELTAPLVTRKLSFDLVVPADRAMWGKPRLTAAVKARGFKVYANHDEPNILSIQVVHASDTQLDAGAFVEAELQLAGPSVVEIAVGCTTSEPAHAIAGWVAGLVVTAD